MAYPILTLPLLAACSAGTVAQPDWSPGPADSTAGQEPTPGSAASPSASHESSAAASAPPSPPPAATGSADAASTDPPTPPVADASTDAGAAGKATRDAAAGGKPAFNAGAGALQSDGKTVVFHIAPGTGNKDWDTSSNPIRAERGMDVLFVDDDPTAVPAHYFHTFGQPCPHPFGPVSTVGNHCVINQTAPFGMQQGILDHNGGRIFLEVVQN